jgi:hypothetical protein
LGRTALPGGEPLTSWQSLRAPAEPWGWWPAPGRPTQRQQAPIRNPGWNLPPGGTLLEQHWSVLSPQLPGRCGQQRQERTEDVGCNRRWLDLELPDLRRERHGVGVQISCPAAASPPDAWPQGGGSPRTGLTHRTSWEPVAATCERSSFSSVVPPTGHKQRSLAVHSGQSRSVRSLRDGRWAGHTLLTCGG